jgi:hypothetical protein
MPFRLTFGRRLYGAALYLYPPAFRREFGPEMIRDFDEALAERWCRRGLLALFLAHIGADLARSAAWQWLRSGLPAVAAAAASATLVSLAAMSHVWPRPTGEMVLPSNPADRELLGLLILAVLAILLIATTIVLTLWAAPVRRLQRRRR